MGSSFDRNLCVTIAFAMLTACGGSGGVPSTASSLQAAQARFGQEVHAGVLSGEYVGKFHDAVHRASRVRAIISQSQNALGGVLVDAGSQGNLVAIIAWTASGNMIHGNGVGPAVSGSGICTLSMTATYKHRRIAGSYIATYGCPGRTGTFSLWHKCYFQSMGNETIRQETGVRPC